jgi:2C-methyl-D-erythritol 2,4-cyclodiphosphate synthase
LASFKKAKIGLFSERLVQPVTCQHLIQRIWILLNIETRIINRDQQFGLFKKAVFFFIAAGLKLSMNASNADLKSKPEGRVPLRNQSARLGIKLHWDGS